MKCFIVLFFDEGLSIAPFLDAVRPIQPEFPSAMNVTIGVRVRVRVLIIPSGHVPFAH